MAYSSIIKPSDYFQTKLYTGNGTAIGSGGLSVTLDKTMTPNFIWLKNRTTSNSNSHQLYDTIRGVTKGLKANSADAENTNSERLTNFNSNGFTVGNNGDVNTNGTTYVAWNWKAGTSFTNDASGTGIGSIDSAGSVNQDAGFSICTFTGTGSAGTIKHGLNTVPTMIIVKGRNEAKAWTVYHSALGAGKALFLATAAGATTSTAYFGGTTPTSSVFSTGSSTNVSGNNITFVAYCFADVQGYSKMGSYKGNGNANGTFINTGFSPAFLMIKQSAASNDWFMIDNKREPFNPNNVQLVANGTSASTNKGDLDLLSNGFKPKSSNAAWNENNAEYIYMAFAENPFVASNYNAATAR